MKLIRIASLLAGLLTASVVLSQVNTGTIVGTVKDSSGAVIPRAKVTLLNQDTGISRAVESDAAGRYTAASLGLGSYRVSATKEGFQTEVRTGIVLTVGQEAVVDLALPVGAVTQTVEVAGEAPRIETTNATVSGLVTQDQMRDLPLNGRSADNLALLSPGVILNTISNSGSTLGFGIRLSVDGARPDSMLYLLDGSVVNDASQNGHGGAAGQSLGVEGILEFRILTHNFSAEYGRNAGGVVSSVTRSGTNQFHGSAYEFVRNNDFDARNFFNRVNAPLPSPLPPFHRNQFGGAAGGRIIKNRLFFFANYEGLRQVQTNTLTSTVPTANGRLGILPTGKVPVNSVVVPYVNLYPLPNAGDNGDGTGQYAVNAATRITDDYAMERMDFHISDKDNFFMRYVYDPSGSIAPAAIPITQSHNSEVTHLVMLSETHIFSGTSLNDFRFAFNRTVEQGATDIIANIDPSLTFLQGRPLGGIGYGGGAGQSSLTQIGSNGGTTVVPQNRFQEGDTFSLVRGAHSLKFGGEVEREQINFSNGVFLNGIYNFGGLQSLLAGQPTLFEFSLTSSTSNPERGWRRIFFDGFVQDDWKIRSNLTVNLGLRYEVWTSPVEVNGLMAAHILPTDTTNKPGSPYISPKKGFAPRIGLAWDPTGNGKTSVRLGGGVFYNQFDGRDWYYQATNVSDFVQMYTLNNPVFPRIPLTGLAGTQSDWNIQYHPQTPTVFQYNLEVQRQLPAKFNFRVAYVGSHGYHLTTLVEQNLAIPTIQPNGSYFFPANAPITNPNFAQMQAIKTEAIANYNAMQLQLQKTLSAGFQFQLSYTYAKTMSDADQIVQGQENSAISAMAQNVRNIRADYSLSALDQRNTLVWNGSYQLPFDKLLGNGLARTILGGWSINGIYSYGSGRPISIATGFNQSQDQNSNNPDRPNLAPGASNNPINGVTAGCKGIPAGQPLHTPTRWYDPCAFVLEPAGTYGNLGRYTVTGPGINNVDASLVKDTTLRENMKLEFRAEAFNLFNHAQFGLPSISAFSGSGAYAGNAGKITTTSVANRQLQLGMKLIF